jgi:DNA-binding transcriptional regulator GbsR (MarR family)
VNDYEDTLLQSRKKMMHALASIMDWYNLTPSASELYALMFFKNQPMTLEDMKDVMGMSKSNMSYAVRSLIDAKMVLKLDYKSDRRELFQADPDFLSSFKNFLTAKLEKEIAVMTNTLEEVMPILENLLENKEVPEDLQVIIRHDYQKAQHAKAYYHWLKDFVLRLKQEALAPIDER